MRTALVSLEVIEGAYTFLRKTPPFYRWGLPEADTLSFRVTRHADCLGQCWLVNGVTGIDISELKVGHTTTLMETMSHEMIHLWQLRSNRPLTHNSEFKRRAGIVCQYHGFDPKNF